MNQAPPSVISFNCGHCGTKLEVPIQLAGVSGPCPSCKAQITAPSPREEAPDLLSFFQDDSPPARGTTAPVIPREDSRGYQQTTNRQVTPSQPSTSSYSAPPSYSAAPPSYSAAPSYSAPPLQEDDEEPEVAVPVRTRKPSKRAAHDEERYPEKRRGGLFSKVLIALLALGVAAGAAVAFSPKIRRMVLGPKGAVVPAIPKAGQKKTPEPAKQDKKQDPTSEPLPDIDPVKGGKKEQGTKEDPKVDVPLDGEGLLAEPRSFLDRFLRSPKWEDLVPMSIKGNELKERMAAYYREHPYAPESVLEIAFTHKQKLPETGMEFFLFRVVTESNKDSFPMVAEQTKEGMNVDWLSFVQFKDKLLQKFMEEPVFTDRPQTFSAMMQRSHYFMDDVPDRDQKDAFQLMEPDDRAEAAGWAFVPKFSNLSKDLEKQVEWSKSYFPILELQWYKDDKKPTQPFVRIMSVKQYNWRWYDPSFESDKPTSAKLSQDSEPSSAPGLTLGDGSLPEPSSLSLGDDKPTEPKPAIDSKNSVAAAILAKAAAAKPAPPKPSASPPKSAVVAKKPATAKPAAAKPKPSGGSSSAPKSSKKPD